MHTKFSGANSQSAARWLRTIAREDSLYRISPLAWLSSVDTLLEGEAARWADTHPYFGKLFNERLNTGSDLNDEDVRLLKTEIQKVFPPATGYYYVHDFPAIPDDHAENVASLSGKDESPNGGVLDTRSTLLESSAVL